MLGWVVWQFGWMVLNLTEGKWIGQGLSTTALSSICSCKGVSFNLISFSTFFFNSEISLFVHILDMMWSRTWSVISVLSKMSNASYALKLGLGWIVIFLQFLLHFKNLVLVKNLSSKKICFIAYKETIRNMLWNSSTFQWLTNT